MGCEDSITKAIEACPKDKKDYVRKEWGIDSAHMWANYARQHSALLLQVAQIGQLRGYSLIFIGFDYQCR